MSKFESCTNFVLKLARALVHAVIVVAAVGPLPAAAGETYPHAVVAADHELASAAGVEILQQGGNVVDAAVATSFALAVVRPESCGLGGGGFMLIWNAQEQSAVALDYRERAPAAATRDMFVRSGVDPAASRRDGLAIGVPGTVAGLCYALDHYGTLSREQVLAPALRLARDGVPIDAMMRDGHADALSHLREIPDACVRFAPLFNLYLDPIARGEQFQSPLVAVLQRIADDGPAGFYDGTIGEAIVATVQQHGGIISADDLRTVQPVAREPVTGEFDGLTVLSMPPPSSGGVALLECLGILEAYAAAHPEGSLRTLGHNNPEYVHLIVETLKHAFADRARYLGDADFTDVPLEQLLESETLEGLASGIDMQTTRQPDAYGRAQLPDDAGTSHFSIIDASGNAVACTETINTSYGSLVVVPEFGIVLNNEMDDFSAVPGRPNAFGLIQSEANAIEPGKKPLSSMSPTILLRDGKAVYAAGASGGPRIISATLQVLLNLSQFNMTPEQAVNSPRFHHQWSPNELRLERAFEHDTVTELEHRGHPVVRADELGAAQAASRTDRGLTGGSDPRKGGRPHGW